jgi:hypothetical protein
MTFENHISPLIGGTERRLPRPMVARPARVQGGHIIETLRARSPVLVGPHPEQLAIAIEDAFEPVVLKEADGLEDFIPPAEREALELRIRAIEPIMTKLIKAAPPAGKHGALPGMPHVDPVASAAARVLGRSQAAEVARVVDAFRMLSGVDVIRKAGVGGMAPVVDAVHILVRVVVAYLHLHNMPVSSNWNTPGERNGKTGRRSDDECLPVSPAAELLCLTSTLWGIKADNSTLRVNLSNYVKKLAHEHQVPQPSDVLLIDIDPC